MAALLLASGAAIAQTGESKPMNGPTGEFREGVHRGEHGTRNYRLYVPSGASSGGARPLIVMLHGCTQDAADFAAGTRANEVGERAGAFVLYPEQPASAHPQKCWSWYDPAHQERGSGEPALLAGMTRAVLEEVGADPARVFVAGMSAGGSMAQILAATYPDIYHGLAVHSAPPYRSARDVPSALAVLAHGAPDTVALRRAVLAGMGERARPIPTLVIHGAEDTVVRVVNGQQVFGQWGGAAVAAAEGHGGPGLHARTPTEPAATAPGSVLALPDAGTGGAREGPLPVRHGPYPGAPVSVEYWEVEGLGHAWSGGSPEGTYTDARGPDATAAIFAFFLDPVPAGS